MSIAACCGRWCLPVLLLPAVASGATAQGNAESCAAPSSATSRPDEAAFLPTPPAGPWGIIASATAGGGLFRDAAGDAETWLSTSGVGIQGFGAVAGGYFQDLDNPSSHASVASDSFGLYAFGTTGGYFGDSDSSGYTALGSGEYGIEGHGSASGGYFADGNESGYAYVGHGDYGITAYGTTAGGYLHADNGSAYAYLGSGINGIDAHGLDAGGHFYDTGDTSRAVVGAGDLGIVAYGSNVGGLFQDSDSSSYAYVAYSTYKIYGSGTASFVQNHPADPGEVIVYAAPEGDEVATYTRGAARLADGEAVVPLGETFRWVTDPDVGLTAYVSPLGAWCDLYVAEKGTDAIRVRSRDGSDCAFAYIVYGLRIGFERSAVVQEKARESFIPSFAGQRALLARRPDLARFTALARFGAQRRALGSGKAVDLSRAAALVRRIHEFDPAVDGVPNVAPPAGPRVAVADRAVPPAAPGRSASPPACPPAGAGEGVAGAPSAAGPLDIRLRTVATVVGIATSGTPGGGYFRQPVGSSEAWLAMSGFGIEAFGYGSGGYFRNTLHPANDALLASGAYGADAQGGTAGGLFNNSAGTSYAYAGYSDYGLWARGHQYGGYFADSNSTGNAYLATAGIVGISAAGSAAGGYFQDLDGTSWAYLGYNNNGIDARGTGSGGFFQDANGSGRAFVGNGDYGIQGYGSYAGGSFNDDATSAWADVAYSTYKISGTGAVSFVQNHPFDPRAVIVYAAPEGDEVATYTRGTARLSGGEARVALGETYRWVTDPDLGLTAYLTPVGDWCDLYVVEVGTDSLAVRSRDGSDCTFNYLVYGLRLGFEDATIVQEKQREAFIPSFRDHRELLARRPDLAAYTPLARFSAQRRALGDEKAADLSRADALAAAIHEFDPREDAIEGPGSAPRGATGRDVPDPEERATERRAAAPPRPPLQEPAEASAPEPSAGASAGAARFRPQPLSTPVEVSSPVEPGDVLAMDGAGSVLLSDRANQTNVLGVAGRRLGDGSTGDSAGDERVSLVFSGIVRCKVDADYGAIAPGDLLVSSPLAGHAMRAGGPSPGAILGRALAPLDFGTGTIPVLVGLQ